MATHTRRTSRSAMFEANFAETLTEVLEIMERDPASAAELLRGFRDKVQRAEKKGWRFVMVNPERYAEALLYLIEHSRRPKAAVSLLANLMANTQHDSQEIQVTRQQLAKQVGIHANHVSACLSEMEAANIIRREKDGPYVRLYLNPWLATHVPLDASDKLREDWPDLSLPRAA